MGWRFRKRVSLGPFLRVNLSGSGVSLGVGPRGANINISKRGLRSTVGLPGTGISYTTEQRWAPPSSSKKPSSSAYVPPPQLPSNTKRGLPGIAWFFIIIGGLGFVLAMTGGPAKPTSSSSPPASKPTPPPQQAAGLPPAPSISYPYYGRSSTPQAAPAPSVAVTPTQPTASNRPLTAEEVREMQTVLNTLGYDSGTVDGIVGPQTVAAVKRMQTARGVTPTGTIDLRLLEDLRDTRRALAPARP
jgi:hypothetical protein